MNLKEDDRVSAVALVVESEAGTGAPVAGDENGASPVEDVAAPDALAPDSPEDV